MACNTTFRKCDSEAITKRANQLILQRVSRKAQQQGNPTTANQAGRQRFSSTGLRSSLDQLRLTTGCIQHLWKLQYSKRKQIYLKWSRSRHYEGAPWKPLKRVQSEYLRLPPRDARWQENDILPKKVYFHSVVWIAPACCRESCDACKTLDPWKEFVGGFKETRNKCQRVPEGTFCGQVDRRPRPPDAVFDIDESDALVEMCRSQAYDVSKLQKAYLRSRVTHEKMQDRQSYAAGAEADAFFAPHYQDELFMVLRDSATE